MARRAATCVHRWCSVLCALYSIIIVAFLPFYRIRLFYIGVFPVQQCGSDWWVTNTLMSGYEGLMRSLAKRAALFKAQRDEKSWSGRERSIHESLYIFRFWWRLPPRAADNPCQCCFYCFWWVQSLEVLFKSLFSVGVALHKSYEAAGKVKWASNSSMHEK